MVATYRLGAVLLAASTIALGQCPASGMSLTFTGGRLGDPFALNISGTPLVPGLLAFDVAGGPSPSPIGQVCLGLTPALQIFPITLDGAGQFGTTGLLPLIPALGGQSVFMQAAASDASQPGGVAISNGASVTMKPPRLILIQKGNPLFGILPSWFTYDPVADVPLLAPIPLPAPVATAVLVPALGWVAFSCGDVPSATIECFDTTTGGHVLSIPHNYGLLAVDGTMLYISNAASPSGVPGSLSAYSLPSGAPVFFVQLASGNPTGIFIPPGSGVAYLFCQLPPNVFVGNAPTRVVNLAIGLELPPILLGGSSKVSEWVLQGTTLYCLMRGGLGISGELAAIDTTTHLPLFPSAVSLGLTGFGTSNVSMLRHGPSQFGNMLSVYQSVIPAIIQINPATLTPVNFLPAFSGFTEMTLSAGGTEWLLMCNALIACQAPGLYAMSVPSMSISPVAQLTVPINKLIAIPSGTLRRAFTISGNNTILPFNTDPVAAPIAAIPLPGMVNEVLVE